MRTAMLLPLACLSIHAGEGWTEAQAAFKKELQPGFVGCLVYVERLDAASLRVRVLAQDTRFGLLEGEPVGFPQFAFKARPHRGSADLRLVTVLPEGAATLRLKLQGDDVSSEVLLHVPKPGDSEGTVLQFEMPAGSGASSKSR